MSTLILVGNSSEAKLFESENRYIKELSLLKQLSHPESRKKGADLVSDGPGHYQTDHSARSAYEGPDPVEHEKEIFALELADEVKNAWRSNSFDNLILVLSPHLQGIFKKHFDTQIPESEITFVSKDYTNFSDQELSDQLRKQLELI